jgi:hypothetical protein
MGVNHILVNRVSTYFLNEIKCLDDVFLYKQKYIKYIIYACARWSVSC